MRIVSLFPSTISINAVRLCACSQDFESKPCREICKAYGLACHVSNYLGRIPKSRCCTNYKVVVYRISWPLVSLWNYNPFYKHIY